MFALDARSGTPCVSFGDHGQIDLKEGSQIQTLGFYEGTSPPVVTDKVLIVGGAVIDNYSAGSHRESSAASTFIRGG